MTTMVEATSRSLSESKSPVRCSGSSSLVSWAGSYTRHLSPGNKDLHLEVWPVLIDQAGAAAAAAEDGEEATTPMILHHHTTTRDPASTSKIMARRRAHHNKAGGQVSGLVRWAELLAHGLRIAWPIEAIRRITDGGTVVGVAGAMVVGVIGITAREALGRLLDPVFRVRGMRVLGLDRRRGDRLVRLDDVSLVKNDTPLEQ